MIVAKIQVSGAIARTLYKKVIPAGIIGAQVEFEYAEDIWQGLSKTVVFRGPVTKDVVTDANIVTIPQEVTEKPMSLLSVGVYGVDADGNLAIPTIWADLGLVRDAANPSGDATTDPSLPIWAQIQAMIGNLDDLDTTAKNNLVAAVNEALRNGGGAVDEAEIRRIVEDYLAANPPAPGAPGPVGATPNIQIGTVETLAAGSPATASMGGTPENPILNLGIPQGAPGSGGSGIAVTGATVGQTVKIAAVDDNGVPTAWEPVDLPSGGGKETWELISEGTITEEVTNVHITEDINGEPFELSKLYAYFKIEPCATVATNAQYAAVKLNDKSATISKSANGDKTRHYQCVAVYVGCSVIVGQSMSNLPFNSAWSFDNHSPGYNSWIKEGSIKKVSFMLGNGASDLYVGVGSKYVLYGVRA